VTQVAHVSRYSTCSLRLRKHCRTTFTQLQERSGWQVCRNSEFVGIRMKCRLGITALCAFWCSLSVVITASHRLSQPSKQIHTPHSDQSHHVFKRTRSASISYILFQNIEIRPKLYLAIYRIGTRTGSRVNGNEDFWPNTYLRQSFLRAGEFCPNLVATCI
jgi:hypothetical protein